MLMRLSGWAVRVPRNACPALSHCRARRVSL